jgi:hypothetical protein
MSDKEKFGIILIIVISYILGLISIDNIWEEHAVEHGYGEYDSKTGDFKFILKDEE